MYVNEQTGQCLAAHDDNSVFTNPYNPNFTDQLWPPYQGNGEVRENWHLAGRCLAAHADGAVFLSPCNEGFNDQHWTNSGLR
ncbi:hypothetical protein GCM10010174_47970 [Kutzneria viridogrisea]|nr:hypothetical protein [Kutzneria viridogrisea]